MSLENWTAVMLIHLFFQLIQMFANVTLDAASVDYHVNLAQRIAQTCLTHQQLRSELFSQLIKLTNRRESEIHQSTDNSYLQVRLQIVSTV